MRIATYNMARLTKIQLQCFDALYVDMIGLTEVWDSAASLDNC
jgi:hypothetical protein